MLLPQTGSLSMYLFPILAVNYCLLELGYSLRHGWYVVLIHLNFGPGLFFLVLGWGFLRVPTILPHGKLLWLVFSSFLPSISRPLVSIGVGFLSPRFSCPSQEWRVWFLSLDFYLCLGLVFPTLPPKTFYFYSLPAMEFRLSLGG